MCVPLNTAAEAHVSDDMFGSVAVFYASQARYDTAERFANFSSKLETVTFQEVIER